MAKIEVTNFTVTESDDCTVRTTRSEFNDDTEYVSISLHCDELNVEQDTTTLVSGTKVKTFKALDHKGNEASLIIFFRSK